MDYSSIDILVIHSKSRHQWRRMVNGKQQARGTKPKKNKRSNNKKKKLKADG